MMNCAQARKRKTAFLSDRRGMAAVEFALIAPLLCLLLGMATELTRMMMFYRQFQTATVGVARLLARYPEFEIRARENAKPLAAALFPAGDISSFNMIVYGLYREGGAMKESFPGYVLFGTDPSMYWSSYVKVADYVEDESLIFVGASYKYRTLFPDLVNIPITFHKDFVILPSFGRKYPYNSGQVDDSKYVY